MSHGNKTYKLLQEGSASTAILPASTFNVMGQHNKIEGIAFKAEGS
jgi:hypothetical protein